MCGIVGFTGRRQAAPILLDGLAKLEYRGYDSAGLAIRDGDEPAQVVKAVGKLRNLAEKTDGGAALAGCCGIGHTRWATHGAPSLINAHPHVSGSGVSSGSDAVESQVVGVHNGIIENCSELKAKLERHGYTFYSDTDTETAVKLVDYYYKKYKLGPVDALTRAMVRIQGSYALALMFQDYPGEIFAARKDSPMILGVAEGETYLASDVPAILNDTRDVYYIGNQQAARLSPGEIHFYDLNGDEVELLLTEITWDAQAAEKGGYQHFMLKEIHEQPAAVRDTLNSLLKDGRIDLSGAGLTEEVLQSVSSIHIGLRLRLACGGGGPVRPGGAGGGPRPGGAGLRVPLPQAAAGRERLSHRHLSVRGDSGHVGRPAGGKAAGGADAGGGERGRLHHRPGGRQCALHPGGAGDRRGHHQGLQLMAMYALAVQLAQVRGKLMEDEYTGYIEELAALPDKIARVLEDKGRIQWFAAKFANARDIFFLGRGADYAASLEGSLKMKEISYIHSEAYAAGELKHGTISLVEDNTLVIGVLTQSELYEKTISNMAECKARGAYLMGLTCYGHYSIEDTADFTVYIPKTAPCFTGLLAIVPLQLLGYYTSVARGLDVDKPRNLAKSVTVE